MDQAMVKRGIGAVVLAIIAALLLGYLLKGKSRERQEAVDMAMPDSVEMSIPDLGTSSENNTTGDEVSIVGETRNTVNQATGLAENAQNAVVASANAVNGTLQNTTTENRTDATYSSGNSANDPGFSIRPSVNNETREIVDQQTNAGSDNGGSAAIAYSTDPVNEVIASSKKAVTKFKPSIVEEKRKPKKHVKKAPKKAIAKKPVKAPAPAKPTKPEKPRITAKPAPVKPVAAAPIASKPLGKYSIQLLATSSQSRANKLANTMKSEGYKVFVTRTQNDSKVLFRVRVGGHANRDEAVKAQDGMKRRYKKNFFVQNSLVVSN